MRRDVLLLLIEVMFVCAGICAVLYLTDWRFALLTTAVVGVVAVEAKA